MKIKEYFYTAREWIYQKLNLSQQREEHLFEELEETIDIPEQYAQRFTLHPIYDPKQVLAREEELDLLKQSYENWKISNNPILLVGEVGAGMTSLLNASTQCYPEAKILENKQNLSSKACLLYTSPSPRDS